MNQEWHVTTDMSIDPTEWARFCRVNSIKPLYIELNTYGLQLMCQSTFDPTEQIKAGGFPIVRVKHEYQPSPLLEGVVKYWECHCKFNGSFRPDLPMASRDLYRPGRWYVTQRSYQPFDPKAFAASVCETIGPLGAQFQSFEYEACVQDTNEDLDKVWIQQAHALYQMLTMREQMERQNLANATKKLGKIHV